MRAHLPTKTNVEVSGGAGAEVVAGCDLIRALEADERFRRDTLLGGVFHPGRICFREISPTDSLHVVIRGDRVSAHVDEISPLVIRPDGSHRYVWGRVMAHNLLVLLGDVARRVRGHEDRQRCDLRCRAEWVDDAVEISEPGPET
jgi:hypothetical protein